MLKKTKRYTGPALTVTDCWHCPAREAQIEAAVCGRIQTSSRRKCERVRVYEEKPVDCCPHLDSELAVDAWLRYQSEKTADKIIETHTMEEEEECLFCGDIVLPSLHVCHVTSLHLSEDPGIAEEADREHHSRKEME